MPWTPPSSAEPFVIRPLDKGVRLDGSTLTVPDGSMLQSDNFIANLEGHRRRPGYSSFGQGATIASSPEISPYPDDPAETTYIQDAWATVDGWTESDAWSSLSVASGMLTCTASASGGYFLLSKTVAVSGKTIRCKIKSSISGSFKIIKNAGSDVVIQTVSVVANQWYVVDAYAVDGTIVKLQLTGTIVSGAKLDVDWVYIGTGKYLDGSLANAISDSYDATIYGAVPDGAGGLIGDGVNDSVKTVNEVPIYENMTRSCNLKLLSPPPSNKIFLSHGYYDITGEYFWIKQDASIQVTRNISGSNSSKTFPGFTLTVGVKYALAFVSRGIYLDLYVNGLHVSTLTFAWAQGTTARRVTLLAYDDTTYNASVEESYPRIYNRALTAPEVNNLANGVHWIDEYTGCAAFYPAGADYAYMQPYRYRPVDIINMRDADGIEVTLLLTVETLYLVDARDGYTEVPWAYSTGTVSVSGGTVTGAGTDWVTAGILPGDIIRVGTEETKVLTRTSGTELLVASGAVTAGTGLAYSIQRTFSPGRLNAPQWVKTPDGVAIADGKHELLMYDVTANTVGYWITDAGKRPPLGATIPAVVGYDGARVFQGNLSDSDGDHASMLQWSGLADNHDFNFAENWQDFPQFTGSLLRVLPLQDKVMLYFTDGVKSGAPTNYPTAPYRYISLETGPLGLVGAYAVTPYLGGHFFISQNGFYFTNGSSYEDISVPISRAIQQISISPEWSYVCADPLNYSVMFGIPEDGEYIQQIWRLDPRSKSWSRDLINTQMIANPVINSAISWADLSGISWSSLDATYPTWDSLRVKDTQRRVIIESTGQLYRGTVSSGADFDTVGIAGTLMTKDYDFSAGDTSKAFTRFGVKITSDGVRIAPIVFAVYGSQNRGRNWKFLGNMTIPVDRDEGYVNFGMLGSTIRFRLETSSMDTSYFIIEHGIYVRGSGNELGTALHA